MSGSQLDSKVLIANLPGAPGVYQMLDNQEKVLYVGKARNLKKRVASYFQTARLNTRLLALMRRVNDIQITVTANEIEALLLEQNLIKTHSPNYNIMLRDDKSYPGIRLSEDDFPRVYKYRGTERTRGKFFGPYPNGAAVRESLDFLHKTFKLRQCQDTVFKHRTRPCLQYQINRCSAPCVGLISQEDYARSVDDVVLFLQGNSRVLLDDLGQRMDKASECEEYEQAAVWRDRIKALRYLQQHQYIEGEQGNTDIIAVALEEKDVCAQVLYVRDGRVLGSRSYFPKFSLGEDTSAVLTAFVAKMYLSAQGAEIPSKIILSHSIEDKAVIQDALIARAGRKISVLTNVRGARARWLKTAATAAEENLMTRLASMGRARSQVMDLARFLKLTEPIKRIECFDISHQSGNETVASCVVFGEGGEALKKDYRRFNIKNITAGDDYAAINQAITRRYTRLLESESTLPELILIDGGKGQLHEAEKVCAELGINDSFLLAVAKGPTRREGHEQLISSAGVLEFAAQDESAMKLIRRVRDEAHRFAITGHRGRSTKRMHGSNLDSIPGLGAKRRHALYRHFGGIRGMYSASAEDLARVPGISQHMAESIHHHLASQAKVSKI